MVTWVWGDIHYPPLPTFLKHIASLSALCWAGLTKVGQTWPSERFHNGQKLGSAEPIHCCIVIKLTTQAQSWKCCLNNNSFINIRFFQKKKCELFQDRISKLPKASKQHSHCDYCMLMFFILFYCSAAPQLLKQYIIKSQWAFESKKLLNLHHCPLLEKPNPMLF